jgi:shikimate kinase
VGSGQSAVSSEERDAPLLLIGYRGTGKSTVAELVARRLGWEWIDADALLEQRAGRTIRQIFEADGEEAFRALEASLLAELCARQRIVVATGGGVVVRPENRQRLKHAGVVVWLTAEAAILWQRLQSCPSTWQRRPNLTVGGLAEITEQLRRREPWYAECAHLVVDTAPLSPAQVAEAIGDKLTAPLPPFSRESAERARSPEARG